MRVTKVKMAAKIIQYNCQRAYGVMCELGQFMLEMDACIAIVQEPFLRNNRACGLPVGMKVFLSGNGKAAVIVSGTSIDCMVLGDCTNDRGVCLWVKGAFGEMFVVSMYCQFGAPLEPYLQYIDGLLLRLGNRTLIIGMDANAVSSLWHSKVGSQANRVVFDRGLLLEEVIEGNRLNVLNEPCECYTFSSPMGQSDIDVTLASDSLIDRYRCSWEIMSGYGTSDHSLIVIKLSAIDEVVYDNMIVPRWRIKEADWNNYVNVMNNRFAQISLTEFKEREVDEQVTVLSRMIVETNDECFSRVCSSSRRKVSWWTSELSYKRGRLRTLRKKFQRAMRRSESNEIQLRLAYARARSEYMDLIRVTKETDWREFVRERSDDPWGEVYRICAGKKARQSVSSLLVNGVSTLTWNESVKVLLEKFFPSGSGSENFEVNVERVAPFERMEIGESILMLKSKKSPGIDGIIGEMCKRAWMAAPDFIESLYNKCLLSGYFPNDWKIANVVILLKGLGRVRNNPESYRPISLLPVLGKALERLMVSRLAVVTDPLLSRHQYGFRKGKSTEDAWLFVNTCVKVSVRKYVLGIFVDFKGAFDNLSWNSVFEKLRDIGCAEIELWMSYFRNRKACVIGTLDVEWKEVERGCPQGSICGPYIWNIMMNELLNELEAGGYKFCAYADDLLVLVEGNSRIQIEQVGTSALNVISRWGRGVGVQVSTEKTVCMLMKGKLSQNRRPNVRLYERNVKYVISTKYLGIHVSERMCFKKHLLDLRDKMRNVVGGLRRVLRKEWGLGKKAMIVLYKGLFLATVTYGASVWMECLRFAYARENVNSVQRIAMFACLNVCRTVSTEAMQVLLGSPPLDLEVLRIGTTFKLKKNERLSVYDIVINEEIAALSISECKRLTHERVLTRWQTRWNESEKGRVTYEFIKDVSFAVRNKEFNPSMSLGYILTGHGSLNEFLFKRGLVESASCLCGVEIESWKHVLTECRLYEDIRDLTVCGISVDSDGLYEFENVLSTRDTYVAISSLTARVFERRKFLQTNVMMPLGGGGDG